MEHVCGQIFVQTRRTPNADDQQVAAETNPSQKPINSNSAASNCSAFITRAIEAGYTKENAQQLYNDVAKESATENIVNFLLRRPDTFGPGVVKKMQNAINPYNNHPDLVESHRSKVAIPQYHRQASDQ